MSDTAQPLTLKDLLGALAHHAKQAEPNCPEEHFFAWIEFMDQRGPEIIALAIAAIGRLGPKEIRGRYGQRMLGQTQARIVECVNEHGPLMVGEIATKLGLNYQNTRRMLPVLEARGLIRREVDPAGARQLWATGTQKKPSPPRGSEG